MFNHISDLARREEDIIQINHKLKEIKAAFEEIDGLIVDQEEVVGKCSLYSSSVIYSLVVEVTGHTEATREDAANALQNVQEADKKTGYCTCTCCYLCTIL